jgi:hypothetical protein
VQNPLCTFAPYTYIERENSAFNNTKSALF